MCEENCICGGEVVAMGNDKLILCTFLLREWATYQSIAGGETPRILINPRSLTSLQSSKTYLKI